MPQVAKRARARVPRRAFAYRWYAESLILYVVGIGTAG